MALESGTLTITLEYGRDLKDRDWVFKQDPYCLITCGRHARVRSRTAWQGGRNPVWNATCTFEITCESEIGLEIKDEEILINEHVGEGIASLAKVRACGSDVQQVPMMYRGKPHGYVLIRLAFVRAAPVVARPQPVYAPLPLPMSTAAPPAAYPPPAAGYSSAAAYPPPMAYPPPAAYPAPPVYTPLPAYPATPIYTAPPVYLAPPPPAVYVAQPPPVFVQPCYGQTVVVEQGYGGYYGGCGGQTVIVEERGWW